MTNLESFSPDYLTEQAKQSGFFQCPKCGLVWFGRLDSTCCPGGMHGKPVHVAVLCRICDKFIPIERLAAHLASLEHDFE
jgi:hypothetical protein